MPIVRHTPLRYALPISDVYKEKPIYPSGDHGRGSLLAPGGSAPWGQNRTAVRHLLILIHTTDLGHLAHTFSLEKDNTHAGERSQTNEARGQSTDRPKPNESERPREQAGRKVSEEAESNPQGLGPACRSAGRAGQMGRCRTQAERWQARRAAARL